MKLLNLPVQFVAVVMTSLVLVIYLVGWSAQMQVESRVSSYRTAAFGESSVLYQPKDQNNPSHFGIEKHLWERMALFACPLH